MINPSRLYSFLDPKNGFALHFFDGQKLIYDLALIHSLKGEGFNYFRDTVLSSIPMISFLKTGESLGLYLDSEIPFFRLKIETNHAGFTRTLLLPEEFESFPERITGKSRITKLFPQGRSPYTSLIEFENELSKNVINRVIKESYQSDAEIIVSENSDQSLILIKLPPINVNASESYDAPSMETFLKSNKVFFSEVFHSAHNDVQKIVEHFEKSSFGYLSSRQVEFFCPCDKERMKDNLRMLFIEDPESIFAGKESLEAKCDYCKKTYEITRNDLKAPAFGNNPVN
jgi:molecular chaperone Hsp33